LAFFVTHRCKSWLAPDDFSLDHQIVRAAQHDQMFDIVAANDHQLPLAVEVKGVHQTEPGLTPACLSGHPQPPREDEPIKERKDKNGDDEHQRNGGVHQELIVPKNRAEY
jgi:hypothetical protein